MGLNPTLAHSSEIDKRDDVCSVQQIVLEVRVHLLMFPLKETGPIRVQN